MGYKLTRESSIPDKKKKSVANPELLEMMQEFYESDMDLASIESSIRTAIRGSKIYLKKI